MPDKPEAPASGAKAGDTHRIITGDEVIAQAAKSGAVVYDPKTMGPGK